MADVDLADQGGGDDLQIDHAIDLSRNDMRQEKNSEKGKGEITVDPSVLEIEAGAWGVVLCGLSGWK
jgi:hypothetical protein